MQTFGDTAEGGFRAAGLLGNPFVPGAAYRAGTVGVRLAEQAAVMRLLQAIEGSSAEPDHRPIVVEKGTGIPGYYPVASLAGLFEAIAAGDPLPGILQAYIPLDMMRMGRVRAALGIIAERVAGTDLDLSLAAWARKALSEPDESLAEWIVLGGADVAALIAEIDDDAAGFSARVFGTLADAREGAEDTELLMRIGTARTRRLETDPSEGEPDEAVAEGVDDEASDDPMGEAFLTTPDMNALPEETSDVAVAPLEELVFDYVVAYTRQHLSPVVARGIRAFKAQGSLAMAQELKVTKAPTKTLAALFEFAQTRNAIGVLTYDGFAMWGSVPTELRMKIVATLIQLRWALKDNAVIVLLTEPGQAPEVEEAFASARRVSWSFSELVDVEDEDSPFDQDIVLGWAASSSLHGVTPEWLEELVKTVPADTGMAEACAALGTVVAHAAETGTMPQPDAFALALASTTSESPTS